MSLLLLFCLVGSAHSVNHRLHYIYTASSKPVSQPGFYQFTAMGILNERLIDSYNSQDKTKIPMQDWMEKYNDEDYWKKGTQSRRSKEQWFDVNVNILIDRMHQNKTDHHTLQWMHGCEVDITDGVTEYRNGFDQYAYDGKDLLSFDNTNAVWVASQPEAELTKKKWDNVPILSQYTKGYLQTDCVHWLEKFVGYQEKQFKTHPAPEVYFFSKKSSSPDRHILVCLATGFYPSDVAVDIFKDGVQLNENNGVTSSGVRPNGDKVETYQLRKILEIQASDTSKYSCQVQHKSLTEPIHQTWDGVCLNCDGGNTWAIVCTVVGLFILAAGFAVVAVVLHKKKKERTESNRTSVSTMPEAGLQPLSSQGSLDSSDSGRGSNLGDAAATPLMENGSMKQLDLNPIQ